MRRYLWCYWLGDLDESAWTGFAGHVAAELGITDLFVSMSGPFQPLKLDASRLARFVVAVHPIEVHAMILESPHYMDAKHWADVVRVLRGIGEYNGATPDASIHGLHIDVEPHATSDFKAAMRDERRVDEIFSGYVGFLASLREELRRIEGLSGLPFSAAVGWWYEHRPVVSIANLGRHLDAIVPMAYDGRSARVGGSVERILDRMPLEAWATRCPERSSFVLGLGIREYDSTGHLLETMERLETTLSERYPRAYGGIALFSSLDLTA